MQKETYHQIMVRPRKVFQLLMFTAIALIGANLMAHLIRYLIGDSTPNRLLRLFDVNSEANIPTFFSVGILLTAAYLLYAVAVVSKRQSRPFVIHWYMLSALFVLLAVDEFMQLHELVSWGLARSIGIDDVRKYYVWVIPGILFLLGITATFYRFLFHLPALLRRRLLLAGAIFVGGAVGLEIVAAFHAFYNEISNLPHSFIFTVEELCEITGVIVMIWALLHYLQDLGEAYHVEIVVNSAEAEVPLGKARRDLVG